MKERTRMARWRAVVNEVAYRFDYDPRKKKIFIRRLHARSFKTITLAELIEASHGQRMMKF